jgi:hypothetical protein
MVASYAAAPMISVSSWADCDDDDEDFMMTEVPEVAAPEEAEEAEPEAESEEEEEEVRIPPARQEGPRETLFQVVTTRRLREELVQASVHAEG